MPDKLDELTIWKAKRDALFRDPTAQSALRWWREQGNPNPVDPSVPLAAVHKARLQWLDATDAQLAESIKWLEDHWYETSMKGSPPLTPERRDADRVSQGIKPLKDTLQE